MEEVIEGVMYPLPMLSRPSEEGGSDEVSRATLLTRLSISPALSSVLSFSSWISLRDNRTPYFISAFNLKICCSFNNFHLKIKVVIQMAVKKVLQLVERKSQLT